MAMAVEKRNHGMIRGVARLDPVLHLRRSGVFFRPWCPCLYHRENHEQRRHICFTLELLASAARAWRLFTCGSEPAPADGGVLAGVRRAGSLALMLALRSVLGLVPLTTATDSISLMTVLALGILVIQMGGPEQRGLCFHLPLLG